MCLMVGDFNINMAKNTTYSIKLNEIIINSGQTQIVDYYTRVTLHTKTIIDLIITNNIEFKSAPLKDQISDHKTIEIKTNSIQNT